MKIISFCKETAGSMFSGKKIQGATLGLYDSTNCKENADCFAISDNISVTNLLQLKLFSLKTDFFTPGKKYVITIEEVV